MSNHLVRNSRTIFQQITSLECRSGFTDSYPSHDTFQAAPSTRRSEYIIGYIPTSTVAFYFASSDSGNRYPYIGYSQQHLRRRTSAELTNESAVDPMNSFLVGHFQNHLDALIGHFPTTVPQDEVGRRQFLPTSFFPSLPFSTVRLKRQSIDSHRPHHTSNSSTAVIPLIDSRPSSSLQNVLASA